MGGGVKKRSNCNKNTRKMARKRKGSGAARGRGRRRSGKGIFSMMAKTLAPIVLDAAVGAIKSKL